MDYYEHRGKCEFLGCDCKIHLLKSGTERCINCNHGSCWHKKKNPAELRSTQFISSRKVARTGIYKSDYYEIPNYTFNYNKNIQYAKVIEHTIIEINNENVFSKSIENLPI